MHMLGLFSYHNFKKTNLKTKLNQFPYLKTSEDYSLLTNLLERFEHSNIMHVIFFLPISYAYQDRPEKFLSFSAFSRLNLLKMFLQENYGNEMKVYIYKKVILAQLIFEQIEASLITL